LWAPLRHQLALSFTRRSESYTELYFTGRPTTTETDGGRLRANVGFAVSNHQGETTSYDYVVTFLDDGRFLGRSVGTVTAAEDETRKIQAAVFPSGGGAAHRWDAVDVEVTSGADLHITYRRTTQ